MSSAFRSPPYQSVLFQLAEHGAPWLFSKAGGPTTANMSGPLETTNAVNRTDGPEERGPQEAAAHANTLNSTDVDSKENRDIAPHQR